MEHMQLPLTQSQKLLWIGQELNPDAPLYNMVMTYDIDHAISLPHFKLAFKKLVEYSDALRYVFQLEGNEPVQMALPEIDYEIEFIDFSDEKDPKASYSVWEKERVQIRFNLKKCAFDAATGKRNLKRFLRQRHYIIKSRCSWIPLQTDCT